jgi:hypothetical protein
MNTGIETSSIDPRAAFVARHARRNFSLNVIEGGLFMFGINMMSSYTVLPYFVKQFSDQQWYQGLIPDHRQYRLVVAWVVCGTVPCAALDAQNTHVDCVVF